jgi:L-rhamnose mutarotase
MKKLTRYCLALDLKDDPALINEYEAYHREVWPEIRESIISQGVQSMEIYRTGTRLFMIMDVQAAFSFAKKSEADAVNLKVQEWEELMWKFQEPLKWAKPGEKWVLMDRIFHLPGVD